MTLTGNPKFRWLGVITLGIAILMLVAAETVLEGKLGPLALAIYWVICMVLTATSILLAFAEARAVQRKARAEHHQLFDSTLRDIEREARQRAHSESAGKSPDVS